jgi:putative FmdB family regulatory protein
VGFKRVFLGWGSIIRGFATNIPLVMPIYAYKCQVCGHAQDILQRMSDPVLTECTQCKAQAFVKQVTAAGFQLKGAGWYVTDFRGGEKAGEGANSGIAKAPTAETPAAAPASATVASPASAPASTPAAPSAPVAAKSVASPAPSAGA